MFKTNNDWDDLLCDIIESPFFNSLTKRIQAEEKDYIIYPQKESRFRAFTQTTFAETRVILCGEEPYSKPNMADGLAYSSLYAEPRPLIHLFRKIEDELNMPTYMDNFDLTRWTQQGVFLLNISLSVRANKPRSHNNMDWNRLTYNAIKLLYIDKRPKVFILLGKSMNVRGYLPKEADHPHLILTGPSPEYPEFFYHDYFQQVNNFLLGNYGRIIDWR